MSVCIHQCALCGLPFASFILLNEHFIENHKVQAEKIKKVENKPMTFEEFDKYSEELIKTCFEMRSSKGKEYAHSSEDRFANFNRLSERIGVSRLIIANVYLQKHLDGINSFIVTGKTHSEERIEGRIVDAITYLMLIAGMIKENEVNSNKKSSSDILYNTSDLD